MRITFFSAALMASAATFAATPIDGWYSSVFGGYTYMPDNIIISTPGLFLDRAAYDSGYNAGGRVGFKSNPLRYEAEFTYINASLHDLNANNISQLGVTGNTSASLAMANIYYDFPDMVPAIQPFLGVGLGYGWIHSTLQSTGPGSAIWYNTGTDNVFAWQATGGFTYNFAECFAVDIAYRYVGTDRADNLGKVFQANLGTVGVTYRFNENGYK
jgi:opacity protein-like surface antigen